MIIFIKGSWGCIPSSLDALGRRIVDAGCNGPGRMEMLWLIQRQETVVRSSRTVLNTKTRSSADLDTWKGTWLTQQPPHFASGFTAAISATLALLSILYPNFNLRSHNLCCSGSAEGKWRHHAVQTAAPYQLHTGGLQLCTTHCRNMKTPAAPDA